jgi:hypothetical protein
MLLIAAAAPSLNTLHTASGLSYGHGGYEKILGEILKPIRKQAIRGDQVSMTSSRDPGHFAQLCIVTHDSYSAMLSATARSNDSGGVKAVVASSPKGSSPALGSHELRYASVASIKSIRSRAEAALEVDVDDGLKAECAVAEEGLA